MKRMFFLCFVTCNLALLHGCSFVSNKLEAITAKKDAHKNELPLPLKNNFCGNKNKLQYISEDEASLKFYKGFHPTLFENKNMPFIQKGILFSLIEMARRPDEVSPFSRLQIYLKLNGQKYYFDFHPKTTGPNAKMPYLKGLDHLTRKFLPGQTLLGLATSLDQLLPRGLGVSAEFESFLSDNKAELAKNEELSERFFKGDEVLTKYETFERVSLARAVKYYLQPELSKDGEYEFTTPGLTYQNAKSENYSIECNFDLTHTPRAKSEPFSPRQLKKTHYTGLAEGDNIFLAASSSSLFVPFTLSKTSGFMKAQASLRPLPLCNFKGPLHDLALFSTSQRSPEQHFQHLISYGIDQIDSPYLLNELLNFSRHLFLNNPDRILYESGRGRKAQLDLFLAMNFPIYHVANLGNIFGHATFFKMQKNEQTLHIDDRSMARLWCRP